MLVDYLIIGQGICGSFLYWELIKGRKSVIVIDESKPFTASKVASGIINPVTGRRIVKTWMIDELLPFAVNAYENLNTALGINCIQQKNVIDFFPSFQMKDAFVKRFEDDGEYLSFPDEDAKWKRYLNYDFGCGMISPCYLVDLPLLLETFRENLLKNNSLREQNFSVEHLELSGTEIRYEDIHAGKIIFCDGISSFNNPFFKNLPFAPNKGEALIVQIGELPKTHILKKGISIVPLKDDLFWVGSSHEWKFEHDGPTEPFLHRVTAQLSQFLKVPFKVQEHIASVRPATLERRPFIGLHPLHHNIGIFNGMGTKGCSLAPFFAKQLADHLVHVVPLLPEADILRFEKILSKNYNK